MDIGYETSNMKFSLRSAALIFNNNCLLIAQNDNCDCFYTVGGGIKENETSENAVIRECLEETGCNLEVDRLVFIQERFYRVDNTRYQEIAFFYLMKEIDSKLCNGINTDQQNEHLYWVPVEELKNANLVPEFLKTALEDIPQEITHIISYD